MSRTWADLAADLALYYAAALLAGATLWAISAWADRRYEKRQRLQERRRLANQNSSMPASFDAAVQDLKRRRRQQ